MNAAAANKPKDGLSPKIIYEDANIVVVSKPSGLLSQGGPEDAENLVDWLKEYWRRQYVGLVHRLDRNTSGIMVVAKRSKAARRLTAALLEGRLRRVYRAWLWGRLKAGAVWKNSIRKDRRRNISKVVSPDDPHGKTAALTVIPLAYGRYAEKTVTLAEFELDTGRSHQIRLQASSAGHPLVGDRKYGPRVKCPARDTFGRPALHSYGIDFPHPISSEKMSFVDPFPDDMRSIRVERYLRTGKRTRV